MSSTTTPPYVDPHPTYARLPRPYSEAEAQQAHAAWRVIVHQVLARAAAPVRSRRAEAQARRAFVLGYVLGSRFGRAESAGSAEQAAHVPLHTAALAVCTTLAGPEVPQVGQFVKYHGSRYGDWGRYWVQAVQESADPDTGRMRVHLTLYRGTTLHLSRVSPGSVTALPSQWWEPAAAGR